MKIEFYNGDWSSDPSKPQSQFASLKGEAMGVDHGLTFNAWSKLNPQQQAMQKISKSLMEAPPWGIQSCNCCSQGDCERTEGMECSCECHE